jgi:sigma-B regulation protein RsbU (phosphoserine phosphatase)
MREMSRQEDPQEMVRSYGKRIRTLLPSDGNISLSRRDLKWPAFRITRYSGWNESINPWKETSRLPLLSGGLLAELLYADEPVIIDDIQVAADDPAHEYLEGMRSMMAIPLFDKGVSLNMVVLLRKEQADFDRDRLPELVWMANLFGRATHNLVLSDQLQEAYRSLDRELQVVADIQRSLLAEEIPPIATMQLAAHYETSRQAGGDYYDFLPLGDDNYGILIADVSGHGTPAAVIMAIMHSIVHTFPGPPSPPAALLSYVNETLVRRYTGNGGTFITAFYGVYNAESRQLCYAAAGHPAPRIKRCTDGSLFALDDASSLPLGISGDIQYQQACHELRPGDQIVFYTDGITEARNPAGEMFGTGRLDHAIENCQLTAKGLMDDLVRQVADFTNGRPADDDRTLVLAKIS